MRLIDADELIENKFKNDISYNAFVSLVKRQPSAQPKLDEWCKDCKEYDQDRHCCPRFNRVIRTTLDDAQPERIRGRWKPFDLTWGRSIYACSVCGQGVDVPTEMGTPIYRYCPQCGADMREDQ